MVLLLLSAIFNAQVAFEIPKLSSKYNMIANADRCTEKECFGKTRIDVYNREDGEKIQSIFSNDFKIDTDLNHKPLQDSVKNSVLINDFNFDGTQDLAVRNGEINGKPIFDVYLFSDSLQQFVPDLQFSKLSYSGNGMFSVDSARKRIITHEKKGCCYEVTLELQLLPDWGLQKVYIFEVDTSNPEKVTTIKSEFIDYKWFTNTKVYPVELYNEEKENENSERN